MSRPSRRPGRGHRSAAALGLAVLGCSIAPLYPSLAGIRPFVLGMPFSMFYLCLLIGIVFASFSALFLADREADAALDREYREQRGPRGQRGAPDSGPPAGDTPD